MDLRISGSAQLANANSSDDVGTPCFKVVLCGDYGVGKTSLFHRFVYDEFWTQDDGSNKSSVLGMDFNTREFDVGDGHQAIKLQLWDTAGIERYASLSPNYYKQSHAVVVCFAADDRLSLSSVAQHVNVAASHCASTPLYFLCAGRADRLEATDAEVAVRAEVRQLVAQLAVDVAGVYVISAATGDGIDAMLTDIARQLSAKHQKTIVVNERTVPIVSDSNCLHYCCSKS